MKPVQFVFLGIVYFAPSEDEAKAFLTHWSSLSMFIVPLRVKWATPITHIEVAPSWVPVPVLDPFMIDYE